MDALPDDPDDLQADLEALAGPSVVPDGPDIIIDGFTGGRLPPKESIREIRINRNPFSAEYQQLGFGRIEILTKPGSDQFHSYASFGDSNAAFNSRNPHVTNKPDFFSRQFDGNASGPLKKRASFFFDLERRDIQDNAIVNATVLDSSLNPVNYQQSLVVPNTRTEFSPRIDYQLNANNTLSMRYNYLRNSEENDGVGGAQFLNLPSKGYYMEADRRSAAAWMPRRTLRPPISPPSALARTRSRPDSEFGRRRKLPFPRGISGARSPFRADSRRCSTHPAIQWGILPIA